jgi:hypothetical protein
MQTPGAATRLVGGLGEIAEAYDAIFCDILGVIHNGEGIDPRACDASVSPGTGSGDPGQQRPRALDAHRFAVGGPGRSV